jgi:hypothetical protein
MNVWPLTAQPAVSVGGVRLAEIAERFGTPAYVLDEEHVRTRYNHFARPPVIAVRDGRARPLIRRETEEDMLRRDVG